jgi:general secretion pathway protein D
MLMRLTFGSVAALAASLLVATAFWPESPQAPAPRNAVAQGLGDVPKKIPAGKSVATEDEDKSAVEKKLAKQLGKIEFVSMPLGEVLEYIGDQIDIDILIIPEGDAGVAEPGPPVNLRVKRAKLSARTALDLVLEPLGLGYTIRDGLILVTSSAQASQIQVYNVRDLLRDGPEGGPVTSGIGGMGGGMMAGSGMGGMGMMQVVDADPDPEAEETQLAQGFGGGGGAAGPGMPGAGGKGMGRGMGGMGMGGMGMGGGMAGGMGGGPGWGAIRQTHSLAQVIATTIDPESWDSNGGNGSVVQYHELLVVKNSQAVHGKIKALLEMMRASARENPEEGGEGAPADAPPAALGVPAGPASRPGTNNPFGVAPPGASSPAGAAPSTPAPVKK